MDLIIWRHAHAGDPLDDPDADLLRPLSPKGERQAARFPRSREAVLVVGHNPTLGLALARLLEVADAAQPVVIKKGAVWWLRTRDREGGEQVTLHAVIGPDNA